MLNTNVPLVRFGVFEVDLKTGELRKAGRRIALQEQPFRVLVRLLEHPGQVVTREELRADLWPADTFVDFEQGLNGAVKRLREALGDSAESPRYIETLARRGYRFVSPVTAQSARPNRHPTLFWAVASVALLSLVVGVVGFRAARSGAASAAVVVRFSVIADAQVGGRAAGRTLATTPDGSLFVFVGKVQGTNTLFLRRLNSAAVTAIPGAEGWGPFLSPDGRWVAFFRGHQLLKAPIDGGPAQPIADAPSGRGGVWRRDGAIFFAPSFDGPIFQVSADGGVAKQVTTLDVNSGEDSHRYPELTSDGHVLLFTARHRSGLVDAHDVVALRLSTGERRTLVHGAVHGCDLADGHLVFARADTLMAVRFNSRTLDVAGTPVSVLNGVDYNWLVGVSDFAVSANGSLVYRPMMNQLMEVVRVERDGSVRPSALPRGAYRAVSLSPDGRSAVIESDEGDRTAIGLADLQNGTIHPVSRGYRDETPIWSPDGGRIFFSSSRSTPMGLFWMPVHSIGEPHMIRAPGQWRFITSITPDGRSVLFGDVKPDTGSDIWEQVIGHEGTSRKLLGSSADERAAQLSPDGRTLVFLSNQTGRFELYASNYPALSQRIQVSIGGAAEPVWAHSGKEVFYRSEDRLMAVNIVPAPQLHAGSPTMLFRARFITSDVPTRSYDILPGDRGFVMIRPVAGTDNSQVNVIANWTEELKNKVPLN